MKLGIAAVYLAGEDDAGLLELHLSRIAANTSEPYTIYAAANRLPPQLRLLLERDPTVRICDLPDAALRGGDEHAFYLELLVAAAIENGATHVCILHLDSFPIRPDWASNLAAKLQGDCVLVGLLRDEQRDRKPLTAFMLFTREFYLTHRPSLRLFPEVLASPEYLRYAERNPHQADTGAGYGFAIHANGLSWLPLVRTDRGPDGWGFGIYGDLVFHLGGAAWWPHVTGVAAHPWRKRAGRWLEALAGIGRAVFPRAVWAGLRAASPLPVRNQAAAAQLAARKARLLAGPDSYLEELRAGNAR